MDSIRRLAAAILIQAIRDARRTGNEGERAREWLLENKKDFSYWCGILDVSAEQARLGICDFLKGSTSSWNTERQRLIASEVRSHPNLSSCEIARRLGVHDATVRNIRKSVIE